MHLNVRSINFEIISFIWSVWMLVTKELPWNLKLFLCGTGIKWIEVRTFEIYALLRGWHASYISFLLVSTFCMCLCMDYNTLSVVSCQLNIWSTSLFCNMSFQDFVKKICNMSFKDFVKNYYESFVCVWLHEKGLFRCRK